MDYNNCNQCGNAFDDGDHLPLILAKCGHKVCRACLNEVDPKKVCWDCALDAKADEVIHDTSPNRIGTSLLLEEEGLVYPTPTNPTDY